MHKIQQIFAFNKLRKKLGQILSLGTFKFFLQFFMLITFLKRNFRHKIRKLKFCRFWENALQQLQKNKHRYGRFI